MRPDRDELSAGHKSATDHRGCEGHHPEGLLRWQDLATTGEQMLTETQADNQHE